METQAPGDAALEARQVWMATLKEVRNQLVLYSTFSPQEEGGWVDLDPAETAAARDPMGSALWPQHQWHAAFEILFGQSSPGATPTRDDMLFFVTLPWLQRAEPYFVRRSKAGMPPDLVLGATAAEDIDWRASVLLNLVMHTRYTLTVIVCSPDSLPSAEESRTAELPSSAHRVVLDAWPSTTKSTLIDLGSPDGKPESVECIYPDICFEVSEYDSVFKSQILEGDNTCYSVVVHSRIGEWFAEQRGLGLGLPDDVVVFSGYVTRDQLIKAGLLGRINLLGKQRAQRVFMTGPGGHGRAEVAVARVSRPMADAKPPPGVSKPRPGGLLRTLRQAAGELAGYMPDWVDFQCALISLELPVSYLADAILSILQ